MNDLIAGFILGVIAGAVFFVYPTYSVNNAIWEKNAIRHGAGQYNSQTSAFEWVER